MTNRYLKKSEESLNPAWNSSNLFYIYLSELDMDFRDAFYINDYDKMDKIARLKYIKIREFVKKKADEDEIIQLEDNDTIRIKLNGMKKGDTDHSNRFNNDIVMDVIGLIEDKMKLMDALMSKAGMNLLLTVKDGKPAMFGGDDF